MNCRDKGEADATARETKVWERKERQTTRKAVRADWEDASRLEDLMADSPNILLAFAGLHQRFGMPVFEFKRITSQFGAKRLLLRDMTSSCYQQGLPGGGGSVDEVAEHLRSRLYPRTGRSVAVGASAGGFAALLFGFLLEPDEVHAFSPQTFIDVENRTHYGDDRWQVQPDTLHRASDQPDRFFDLAAVSGRNAYQRHFTSTTRPKTPWIPITQGGWGA